VQVGKTLCTYLYSQVNFLHVSVVATTIISDDNTANQKAPLLEGCLSCHAHIAVFRISLKTKLIISHIPRMVCSAIFPDDGLVASNETCKNLA
jgi:hypothetical protein